MLRRQNITTAVRLSDAATVNLDPSHDLEDHFDGSIIFDVTSANVSGTTAGNAQLQGSNGGNDWVDIGSPVAIADATTKIVELSGTKISYAYYRVQVVGSGTQETDLTWKYNAKYK